MIITQEWIDIVAPNHSRGSCKPDQPWVNGAIDSRWGLPWCNRCYLIEHIGVELNDLDFHVWVDCTFQKK